MSAIIDQNKNSSKNKLLFIIIIFGIIYNIYKAKILKGVIQQPLLSFSSIYFKCHKLKVMWLAC